MFQFQSQAASSIFLASAVLPDYVYDFSIQGTTLKFGLPDPKK